MGSWERQANVGSTLLCKPYIMVCQRQANIASQPANLKMTMHGNGGPTLFCQPSIQFKFDISVIYYTISSVWVQGPVPALVRRTPELPCRRDYLQFKNNI